ncbi:hypothetical protein, partial [Thermanaerothrix sp.]
VQVAWLGQGSIESREFSLTIKANRWLIPATQVDRITRTLVGQPVTRAETVLGALWKGVKIETIRLFPSWWGRFPFLPWRIHITLK